MPGYSQDFNWLFPLSLHFIIYNSIILGDKNTNQDTMEEDFFPPDDLDVFDQKKKELVKKLPPLSKKKIVIWAFKLSKKNTFL